MQIMMMDSIKIKTVIGRTEKVDFPELGLFNIPAKIDTGAYTSSLHCHDIYEKNKILHFKLVDPSHKEYFLKDHQFTDFSQKKIKNSFGEKEVRYTIKTLIRIGKKRIRAKITLSDRGSMKYPVLIGRTLLKNNFIVDVGLVEHLSYK
jgi:hypothetical protein